VPVFVPVLRFHFRWGGVTLPVVVVVITVALAFPRHVVVQVMGSLCLGVVPTVATSL
jgi:hypothetical protein